MSERSAVDALPQSPRDLLSHWDKWDGERIAVRESAAVLSYSALHGLAESLGAGLSSEGIGRLSQVAIAYPNSSEFISSLFAVWRLGAVAVPLDPKLSGHQLQHYLDSSAVNFLLMGKPPHDGLEAWTCSKLTIGSTSFNLYRRDTPLVNTLPLAPDHLLHRFSSGSTGQPKHILSSERQIAEDYNHLIKGIGLGSGHRFLAVAPFYHAFGGLGLFAGLALGAEIMPVPVFVPARILNSEDLQSASVFFATPAMIDLLGRSRSDKPDFRLFNELEYCICATGKLTMEAHDRFSARFGRRVHVLYGSSETLSATVTDGNSFREDCVGSPFPGVAIGIFGDEGELLKTGEIGDVGINSEACIEDYVLGTVSARKISGYLLPGDKGYVNEAGELFVLGRSDILNIGGYKVDRFEIENLIRENFPVTFVQVRCYDRYGQPSLEAILEGDETLLPSEGIIRFCSKHLVHYKVPSRIRVYPHLARDGNGKVRIPD